ncbi:hypothetical protein [Streptomyces aureoversilis]|uniref:Uncharacterized protein n=1 Tax=Streptomyces aureoversilis TaxID=67277 RepID=A0ABW0AAY0_9ACTN
MSPLETSILLRRSIVPIVSAAVFACAFQSFPEASADDFHGRVTSRVGHVRPVEDDKAIIKTKEMLKKYEVEAQGLVGATQKAVEDKIQKAKEAKKEKDRASIEADIARDMEKLTAQLAALSSTIKGGVTSLVQEFPAAEGKIRALLRGSSDALAGVVGVVHGWVKGFIKWVKEGWAKVKAYFGQVKTLWSNIKDKIKAGFSSSK